MTTRSEIDIRRLTSFDAELVRSLNAVFAEALGSRKWSTQRVLTAADSRRIPTRETPNA